MNDYREVRINVDPCSETMTDILAALLADAGFESFCPDSEGLTAWIKADDYDTNALNTIIATFPMATSLSIASDTLVEGRDWNSEWERNYFKPIVVGNRCVIHSSFHTDIPECRYDIVIDPKMAFGTGHHATTSLILEQILDIDMDGLAVLDMGTGTGILAILAAMRGAASVDAVEIDPFAFENACENIRLNNTPDINIINGDAAALAPFAGKINLFIANINRNVITADIAAYAATLAPGATMLLSGFYVDDIPVVTAAAAPLGLTVDSFTERGRWTCLKLRYDK